jgi:cell division protein FtsQ
MRPQPQQRVAGRRKISAPALPKIDARSRKVSLAVAALLLAMAGGWWLYNSPVFALHGVQVDGNTVISDDVVRQVAGLDGQNIVRPDFAGARGRLLAFALIKDAKVSRDWPFGAHVTVVERQPWGVWQIGDQRYVVDDEGVVLTLPEPQNAPVIVQMDPSAPLRPGDKVDVSAVAVAKQLVSTAQQAIGAPVARIEYSQDTGLTAVLSDNVRVSFGGLDNYEFKVAALYSVLQRAQAEGMSVHAVDLRFGDRVAVE